MADAARLGRQGVARLGGANIAQLIAAAGVGTMIEWYDFYIFGTLAIILSQHFYPTGNPTTALLATFATFGAGFAARPFGALFFGRIGDLVGRKYAFLVTLLIMGGATFLIGLLPDYKTIGVAAPIILVTIRLFQGLALGGEYGGAATYVAEHVADNRRGFFTSFIQTTATLGLFASLLVILLVQRSLPAKDWVAWGWRLPFLLSVFLVAISVFIRLRLRESPMFQALKTAGRSSKAPITDSFGSLLSWQTLLMVLWGATAGEAVVWYTGQFYALSWLQGKGTANVPASDAYIIMAVALALGTPFFVVFGALSDRIGRKWIMMAGNLFGAVLTLPLFIVMHRFTPVAGNYNPVLITLCVFVLVLLVTMVYGPIAAFLVESFPSRVRYTSVSLPYHIGNGYFGGFLPLIATALVASATISANTGWKAWAPYAGLAFPIGVAAVTFVVGSLLLRETKDNAMEDEHMVAQRGFSWPVFGGLVLLSAVALVLADQFLTPVLNTSAFNVQWFFRLLALVIAVLSLLYAISRRLRHQAGTPAPPAAAPGD